MKIDRIVVPLDGSETAEAALPMAGRLASALGAEVELIHVHGVLYGGRDDRTEQDVVDSARSYLDEKVRALDADAGVTARATLLEGVVDKEIREHLEGGPEGGLIVMTTHGRSGISRVWLGSVAEHLVRYAPMPVLLVRPGNGGTDVANIDRVLVALDGSARAERSLPWARALASALEATVTLFAVAEDEDGQPEIEEYLQGLAGADERVVAASDIAPARAILEMAGSGGSQLVAITTRGRSAVARNLFGSVADKVVRSAEVPLLVLNEDGDGS